MKTNTVSVHYVDAASARAQHAVVSVHFTSPGLDQDHLTTNSCLVLLHRFFSWIIGQRLELTQVNLSGEPPDYREEYQRLFRTRILCNQHQNAFHCKQKYPDNPIVQNKGGLKSFLGEAPYNLVVIPDNEIAEFMGLSETSTFHRAFKKWTGFTPGAYRQNNDLDQHA